MPAWTTLNVDTTKLKERQTVGRNKYNLGLFTEASGSQTIYLSVTIVVATVDYKPLLPYIWRKFKHADI